MAKRFGTNFKDLLNKVKQEDKKGTPENSGRKRDERFYDLPWKEGGNEFDATIRFLPPKNDDSLPFVKAQFHNVKGKNGRFMKERCLRDIGKQCPICDYTWEKWAEFKDRYGAEGGKERWKEVCGKMTNKERYFANILVLDDKGTPENKGKVFLWEFPPTIYKIIKKKLYGEKDEDGTWLRKPSPIFDYYEGANFRLKGNKREVGNQSFPNYEDCYFFDPSELYDGDDDKIEEKVHNQLFDLNEFASADNYKDEGSLRAKFEKVIGITSEEDNTNDESNEESEVDHIIEDKKDKKKEQEKIDKQKEELEKNFREATGQKEESSKSDSGDVDLNMADDEDDDDFMKRLEAEVDD